MYVLVYLYVLCIETKYKMSFRSLIPQINVLNLTWAESCEPEAYLALAPKRCIINYMARKGGAEEVWRKVRVEA